MVLTNNAKSVQEYLQFVTARVDLFKTPTQEAFVTTSIKDHKETFEVNSPQFRHWIRRVIFQQLGTVPNSRTIDEVINHCEAHAHLTGTEKHVYTRIACGFSQSFTQGFS